MQQACLDMVLSAQSALNPQCVWSFCFCPTRGCWNVFIAFIGTGILCSGYMCSLPSHPCHSSCISSCCDVLLHCLILGLYHAVHGFLSKLEVWYYIIFLEGFPLWYYKNRHVIYFGYMWNQRLCNVYLDVVLGHDEIFFRHLDGANLIIKLLD